MADSSSSSKSDFPLAGVARDGWSSDNRATATCYCGEVQLEFSTERPGLVNTFVCNCTDCRKITGSMFATNFIVADTHLKYLRGQDKLKTYGQSHTISSGKTMTNYFCSNCGILMNRVGAAYPGLNFLRTGTVDDFHLHETKLKPRVEQYVKDRVCWFSGVDDVKKFDGSMGGSKQKL